MSLLLGGFSASNPCQEGQDLRDLSMEPVDSAGPGVEEVLEGHGGLLGGEIFASGLGVPECAVLVVDFFNRGLELDVPAQRRGMNYSF